MNNLQPMNSKSDLRPVLLYSSKSYPSTCCSYIQMSFIFSIASFFLSPFWVKAEANFPTQQRFCFTQDFIIWVENICSVWFVLLWHWLGICLVEDDGVQLCGCVCTGSSQRTVSVVHHLLTLELVNSTYLCEGQSVQVNPSKMEFGWNYLPLRTCLSCSSFTSFFFSFRISIKVTKWLSTSTTILLSLSA